MLRFLRGTLLRELRALPSRLRRRQPPLQLAVPLILCC